MGDYTDLLYARPSFLEGLARVLDLGSTMQEYNRSITAQQANCRALRSDFCAVGQDMWQAWEQAERESRAERAAHRKRLKARRRRG